MDTSETYIKMCEKAVEIQEIWKSEVIKPDDRSFWIDDFNKQKSIWLPRQDQLQEMMRPTPERGEKISPYGLSWSFYRFIDQLPPLKRGNSFEQLWLAYVMKWEHHKVWNGKDWVKDGWCK